MIRMSSYKKLLLTGYIGSMGILGFKRGTDSYQYKIDWYNKKFKQEKKEFFYFDSFLEGVLGSVMYIAPLTNIFMMMKEVYRLEVHLRGLEKEKDSDWYNRLIN